LHVKDGAPFIALLGAVAHHTHFVRPPGHDIAANG
jgi:hypothetical protein